MGRFGTRTFTAATTSLPSCAPNHIAPRCDSSRTAHDERADWSPEQIVFTIDEALDLLSHLEDAHQSFLDQGLLSGAVLIDGQIRMLNRKLGFDDPGGRDDEY